MANGFFLNSTYTEQMSYQTLRQDHESEVKAIYTGSAFLESSAAGDNVGLVLTSSSFYAEQGGQVIHFI